MIIKDNFGKVEHVNTGKSTKFSVGSSHKAIKILSTSIYQNPLEAVVREYATNAYDAHVDAGIADTPFEVHIPSNLEPYYSVRDFGKGLSEEHLRSLATTYFASDKNNTNNLVGGLGLGFKSAFSVTDSYTIISYFEGMKHSYVAAMGEDGYPHLTSMDAGTPTSEHGLEIIVPIADKNLADLCKKVFYFFPVKPIFKGTQIEVSSPKHIMVNKKAMAGKDWKIVNNIPTNSNTEPNKMLHYGVWNHRPPASAFGSTSNVYVQMGTVAYPVVMQHFNFNNQDKTSIFLLSNAKHDFIIHVPVGSLEINPGRESLSYDDKTVQILKNILIRIADEVHEKFNQMISVAASQFDAHVLVSKIMGFNIRKNNIIFGDMPLHDICIKNNAARYFDYNVIRYNPNTASRFYLSYADANYNISNSRRVIINDTGKDYAKIFKELYADGGNSNFRNFILIDVYPDETIEDIIASLEGHPYEMISDLEISVPDVKLPRIHRDTVRTVAMYSFPATISYMPRNPDTAYYYVTNKNMDRSLINTARTASSLLHRVFAIDEDIIPTLGPKWFDANKKAKEILASNKKTVFNYSYVWTLKNDPDMHNFSNLFNQMRLRKIVDQYPEDLQEICNILVANNSFGNAQYNIPSEHCKVNEDFKAKLEAIKEKYVFMKVCHVITKDNVDIFTKLFSKYI